MSEHAQPVTDATFDSLVLRSEKPVLVDFWAEWCAPCRQIGPIIDTLAVKWGGNATVLKANIEDVQGVAEKYGVMGIPRLLLFKGGVVVEDVLGSRSQPEFEKRFEPHIDGL